ncbi:Ulp1 protease family, C-terminal catalytic domain [Phytophthora cactorum]|nr:Ulp1 protease family, C-terminal catalytic domain [Phytophthora cactorum]
MLKDINAMNRWHTCMEYLSQTEDAINWAVKPSIKHIPIPDQLSDGVRGLTTIVWGTGLRYCNVNTKAGVVNPLFMRFEHREQQLTAIKAGNPFVETNNIVLIPLHVDNNHWCGAVLDFRKESRGITVFDPLQASKSKYYDVCEAPLKFVWRNVHAPDNQERDALTSARRIKLWCGCPYVFRVFSQQDCDTR